MVKLGGTYDSSQHQPHEAFDPLPSGWYAMTITSTEVRRTKDGRGQYLWIEHEIDERRHPERKGRKVWNRLNLWHDNPQTVQIANGQLSKICRSVGVPVIDDTEALHGRPIAVRVKLRAAEGEFDASNDVTGYESIEAKFGQGAPVGREVMSPPQGIAAPPPARQQTAPGATPAPGGGPPWQRPPGNTTGS